MDRTGHTNLDLTTRLVEAPPALPLGPHGGMRDSQPAPHGRPQRTTAPAARLHGLLERAAVLAFPVFFLAALYAAGAALLQGGPVWLILPAILLGLVCGDFVTGLVHWAADTYCSEETPVIGQSFIKPFRLHHLDPEDICRHGVAETLGNTCILACPLLALVPFAVSSGGPSAARSFAVFVAVLTVGLTVATNQFHKWAHEERPPALVRRLQTTGLILGRAHHSAHHDGKFNTHYCITNGWMNPLLDRVRFFRALERALARVGVRSG